MSEAQKSNTSITDSPISKFEEDFLKLQRYAKSLSSFIQNSDTPITIGLQGEWGTGKTSLAKKGIAKCLMSDMKVMKCSN